MIYTLTLNPSLDYVMKMEHFEPDRVNRTVEEHFYVGGKGINVSIILKALEIDSLALGFVAGFTGEEITNQLEKKGIKTEFITLEKGVSRINVKLKSEYETEINASGPEIRAEDIKKLYTQIERLEANDFFVLAGSIPKSMPSDIYQQIMSHLEGRGIHFIVDATKELLLKVLGYRPFLIKPNHHELGEMFGVTLRTEDELIRYAKKLQLMGARNVLVSRAADGALLVTEEGNVFKHHGIKGKVKHSVGAGDSMVAGFLGGYLKTGKLQEAFKLGLVAGSATAFTEDLATADEIEEIMKLMK